MAGGADKGAWVLLLLCCLAMGGGGAPSPSPSVDCSSALLSLADCLPFVQEGSKVAKPEKSCCSGLKKVVKEDVACLCDAFNQSATFGISLNTTRALSLPAACRVSTPPSTHCKIAGAVPGVPSAAPAPAMGAPSSSPSPGKSTSVPAPSPGHSGSSAASFPAPPSALLVSVALAVYSCYH